MVAVHATKLIGLEGQVINIPGNADPIQKFFLFSVLFLLNSCGTHPKVNTEEPVVAKLENIISSYGVENGPGLALAVVHKGEIVFLGGVGQANLEHNIPIAPDTVFDIASVSKQFTAMAVLMLADEGKLKLEDDIRVYLPELPDYNEKIEIRHLLYHTSGLRDWLELLLLAGWQFDDVITSKQIHDIVFQQNELNFVPGSEAVYSNTGYFLLSKIVSRVADKPFHQWMEENIFDPLAMENTHIHHDAYMLVPRRADSYFLGDDNKYKVKSHAAAAPGASAVFSTAEDMARWMLNFHVMQIGSENVMARMNSAGTLDSGKSIDIGPGNFFYSSEGGYRSIYHHGMWPMFNSALYRYPESKLGICMLANSDHVNFWQLANDIPALFGVERVPESEYSRKLKEDRLALGQEQIEHIQGKYWHKESGQIVTIKAEEGQIAYMRSDYDGNPLSLLENNKFRMLGTHSETVIDFDINNEHYDLIQNEKTVRFYKLRKSTHTISELAQFEGAYYNQKLAVQYGIKVVSGALIAQHPRSDEVRFDLNPGEDIFISDEGHFRFVRFVRDAAGEIKGFYLDQWTNKNIWFERM